MSEIHHQIIWVWDNCNKFYPCKPISKEKKVKLRINDNPVIEEGKYDSEYGFFLSNSDLDSNNRFECSSEDHSETYEVRVQLESRKANSICYG